MSEENKDDYTTIKLDDGTYSASGTLTVNNAPTLVNSNLQPIYTTSSASWSWYYDEYVNPIEEREEFIAAANIAETISRLFPRKDNKQFFHRKEIYSYVRMQRFYQRLEDLKNGNS